MADDWTVRVTDATRVELGEISPIQLQARLRWQDTGTWTLDVPFGDRLTALLAEPGSGIVVYAPGSDTPFFAGPRTQFRLTEAEQLQVEVQGVTDQILLEDRLASPDPSLEPPWTVEERVLSGPADEVMRAVVGENLGPLALPARQTVLVDTTPIPYVEDVRWTVTGQPVSDVLEGIGDYADLGWTVDRLSNGDRIFRVLAPVDVSDTVIFSAQLGTVNRVELVDGRPSKTHVVVAGNLGPYDVVRPTVLRTDAAIPAQWGRIESFRDHRQSSDPGELEDVADSTLADQQPLQTVTVDPVDGAALVEFPTTYSVGSVVTVRVEDEILQDVVREVELTLAEGQAARAVPSLQTIRSPQGRAVRELSARVTAMASARTGRT